MDHNKYKNLLRSAIFFIFISFCFVAVTHSVFAQCQAGCTVSMCSTNPSRCGGCPICPNPSLESGETSLGKFEGLGPLGKFIDALSSRDVGTPLSFLNKILSIVIGIITAIGFIYFVLLFFTAALSWISAGGDQKKVESAGKQITNAIIGLVIMVAAIFVTQLLGTILGIDILNPFGFILTLWPK